MKLSANEAAILRRLREGEAAVKADTADRLRRRK